MIEFDKFLISSVTFRIFSRSCKISIFNFLSSYETKAFSLQCVCVRFFFWRRKALTCVHNVERSKFASANRFTNLKAKCDLYWFFDVKCGFSGYLNYQFINLKGGFGRCIFHSPRDLFYPVLTFWPQGHHRSNEQRAKQKCHQFHQRPKWQIKRPLLVRRRNY